MQSLRSAQRVSNRWCAWLVSFAPALVEPSHVPAGPSWAGATTLVLKRHLLVRCNAFGAGCAGLAAAAASVVLCGRLGHPSACARSETCLNLRRAGGDTQGGANTQRGSSPMEIPLKIGRASCRERVESS